MAQAGGDNGKLIAGWVAKWEPLADAAIDAYCASLPDVPNAAAEAKAATRRLRSAIGV
jgi:toluene monooxygenase system protein E